MTTQQREVYNAIVVADATLKNYRDCLEKGMRFISVVMSDIISFRRELVVYYVSNWGIIDFDKKSKLLNLRIENKIKRLVGNDYGSEKIKLIASATLSSRVMFDAENLLGTTMSFVARKSSRNAVKQMELFLDRLFNQNLDRGALNDTIVLIDGLIDTFHNQTKN